MRHEQPEGSGLTVAECGARAHEHSVNANVNRQPERRRLNLHAPRLSAALSRAGDTVGTHHGVEQLEQHRRPGQSEGQHEANGLEVIDHRLECSQPARQRRWL